jgi:16S rRNA (uracil1498-N3)-methyltransferase
MKVHYFIAPFSVAEGVVSVADTKVIHHIKDVLKISVGEKIMLADGAGNRVLIRIGTLGKNFLEGQLLEHETVLPFAPAVTLYAAMLKRDMFELIAQKAVELGVTTIVPVLSERTVKLGFNRERLERIIVEAVEQSEQSIVPRLGEPVSLPVALEAAKESVSYFFVQEGVQKTYSGCRFRFFSSVSACLTTLLMGMRLCELRLLVRSSSPFRSRSLEI